MRSSYGSDLSHCNGLTRSPRNSGHPGAFSIVSTNPLSIKLLFLQSDGGCDVHKQLDLSGEPLIPPLCEGFKPKPPFSAIRCQELSIQGRDSCEAYSDYWNTMTADDVTAVEHCLLLESANYLACQVRRLTLS